MQDLAPLIGRAMLLAGVLLLVIGLLAMLPGVLRVRRRALALAATVAALRDEGVSELALLRAQRDETEALLVPWQRLLRWVRHPLVVATLEWYLRRRRRRSRHG